MHKILTAKGLFRRLLISSILTLAFISVASYATEKPAHKPSKAIPTTTEDIDIPPDELALLVKPLTAEELEVEAQAWLQLLQEKTRETSQAELAVKQKNKAIDQANEVQDALEDTQEILEDVKQASEEAGAESSVKAAENAETLASEAHAAIAQTTDSIEEVLDTTQEIAKDDSVQEAMELSAQADGLEDKAHQAKTATAQVSAAAQKTAAAAEQGEDTKGLAKQTTDAVEQAQVALDDTSDAMGEVLESDQLEDTAQAVAALAESQAEDKTDILYTVNELKVQRTSLVDRLNVILDEWSSKLGETAEGAENELVIPYRLYVAAVNQVEVDVSDTQALWSNIMGWVQSDVGGIRLAKNLGKFTATVAAFWLIGLLAGKLIDKTLKLTRITVELMRSVIVRTVRRSIIIVGIIVGLSTMDINVGPILAVVGAAGFVIAFALQNTLSNFASGIMIMIYRPFDVGDVISVAGVTGVARSMNLVSTTIATLDNQLLVVPNNSIWGNIITNITGSATRRVDMTFGIRYEDDIELAQKILEEEVSNHPLVLKDPEPLIAVQELAEYTVNFVCRPWVKTDDYWGVYRDITRSIKLKFEQAGLQTPYPRQSLQFPAPKSEAET